MHLLKKICSWFSCIIAVLIIPPSCMAKADISVDRTIDPVIYIRLSGTITNEDAAAFSKLEHELASKAFAVLLNSDGGNLYAAMTIGRMIRQHEGSTQIPPLWWANKNDPHNSRRPGAVQGARCYSSCALIFISGVRRSIAAAGELGIHRPYLASDPKDGAIVAKHVSAMLSALKNYVTEMGITDNFYQLMVNTDPSSMIILTSDNYTRVVSKYDPVYDEVRIARQAGSYGITTDEMRRREAKADRCSEKNSRDCRAATLWGLTEQVYRERLPKTEQCRLSDQERTRVRREAPEKQQTWEHPAILRRQACERNIMLGR